MVMTQTSRALVEVKDLKVHFPIYSKGLFARQTGSVKAVDGVSFSIMQGETFGLFGESGCGKTTTGKAILGLYPDETTGSVFIDGTDVLHCGKDEMRKLRRQMQLIFQDPYSSLDPRMTVGRIIEEPLIIHKIGTPAERKLRVNELLETVGLPSQTVSRYPSEFSGGQRQRIGIARALALRPQLIICDEPVSALDVSVQSQVLNLLGELQKEFNLTLLFIAHGLNVVRHVSTRVGVMYLGHMVEVAPKAVIYDNPMHPYTEALMSAIPVPDPTAERRRIMLRGDVPSPVKPPSGCAFHTRCPYAKELGEKCRVEIPELKEIENNHFVACHRCKTSL